jgi:hypothetical protein
LVVEDFRMRRTLGTLLGVELDREDDPLLGGPVVSGNSKVGRTLILTDAIKLEVLALFDAAIPRSAETQAAITNLYAAVAHRVTILFHAEAKPGERALLERVAAVEAPAHTVVRVRPASESLVLGLSALLGVDTYLRPPRPDEPVTVESSVVGGGALLLRPPSLDPRLE